jgi:hypothetical protein
MSALNELKRHLRPGAVYRRKDLEKFSSAVDRHLKQLVDDGVLQKVSGGVYYRPKQTSFGSVPPEDKAFVRAFLDDDRYYLTSFNAYNSIGVGTTQLYNERVVYNHKRDGRHELNGRHFYFIKRDRFPKESNIEFLLVDLINNLKFLAEDQQQIRENVARRVPDMDANKLMRAVSYYAGARTKNFFENLFKQTGLNNAA